MKLAAVTFAALLAVPVRIFPGGGEPVPVVYPPDERPVEVWTVERSEPNVGFAGSVEEQVWLAMERLGRNTADFECALIVFQGESSMRPDAVGDSGNSFGLGQRHAPAHGRPVLPWPVADQVEWFDEYAHDRYGGWCQSAAHWLDRAAARGGRGHW